MPLIKLNLFFIYLPKPENAQKNNEGRDVVRVIDFNAEQCILSDSGDSDSSKNIAQNITE